MKLNILGTEYEIVHCEQHEDKVLRNADGYCDTSVKKIVIDTQNESEGEIGTKKDLKNHAKRFCVMRSSMHFYANPD